jgi:hypothetical protein
MPSACSVTTLSLLHIQLQIIHECQKAVYLKQAQKNISPSAHIAFLAWTINWLFYSIIIQYTFTAHAETKVASHSTVITSQMFSGHTPT